jgi:hypothetical protein
MSRRVEVTSGEADVAPPDGWPCLSAHPPVAGLRRRDDDFTSQVQRRCREDTQGRWVDPPARGEWGGPGSGRSTAS